MNTTQIETILVNHGLRKTKQRIILGQLIFGLHPTHWTAEQLFSTCKEAGHSFSLATLYNTLNQFADKGLLRRIHLQGNLCYYDTNLEPHHHIYHTISKELEDIPVESISATIPMLSTQLQTKDQPLPQFDIIVHSHD